MSATAEYMTVSVSVPNDISNSEQLSGLRVTSLEALGADCKIRVVFKNTPRLSEVLTRDFEAQLVQRVAEFERPGHVLSLPDHVFKSEDLVLGKLTIFGAERDTGFTIVTLRWSVLIGNIFSVLKFGPEALASHSSPHARLGYDVLTCILEPIFDLTAQSKTTQERADKLEMAAALLETLESKREELQKYSELLKIYLKHQMRADGAHAEIQNASGHAWPQGLRHIH